MIIKNTKCPKCGYHKFIKCGKSAQKKQIFKCKQCKYKSINMRIIRTKNADILYQVKNREDLKCPICACSALNKAGIQRSKPLFQCKNCAYRFQEATCISKHRSVLAKKVAYSRKLSQRTPCI